MLKRIWIIGIIVLLILGCCSGCFPTIREDSTDSSQEAESVDQPGQIIMRIGHAQPITHPRHQSYLLFKELVEARTNNAIKVEIYPSAQLGIEASMIEQVKLGTLQGTRGGSFESMAPELLIYSLPFLFDSLDSIQKVTMGPVGEKIAKYTKKNGLVTLATGDSGGFYNFTNNRHPITSPDDMVGLRMRTPPIATKVEAMKAFGAEPVILSYGDVYDALKTGFVDGQDNPFVNIEAMRFHEVQKYLTVVEYHFGPDPFIVNLDWYQGLCPEYQKILKECAVESMKYNDQLVREANIDALENIKKSMQVTILTEAQKQAFIEKVQPVYDYFVNQGIFAQEDIDEIREAVRN